MLLSFVPIVSMQRVHFQAHEKVNLVLFFEFLGLLEINGYMVIYIDENIRMISLHLHV